MSNPTPWRKANKSQSGGNCVLVRRNGDRIEVSDSKLPDTPVLASYTLEEWDAFQDGMLNREFADLLA